MYLPHATRCVFELASGCLQCDEPCGVGRQHREVVCIVRLGDRKIIIDDYQCETETRPETSQSCDDGPCDRLEWITSHWSGVSTALSLTDKIQEFNVD